MGGNDENSFSVKSGLPPVFRRNTAPDDNSNEKESSRNLLENIDFLVAKTLELIHGYPGWFKQRRKLTQFALLYSMIGIIPFILYPFAFLLLKIRSNGFSIRSTPFVFLLLFGYSGAIVTGFVAGNKGLGVYVLISVFTVPFLYVKKGKGTLGIGIMLSLLMLFGIFVGDGLGVSNSLLGSSTRTKIQNLLKRDITPSDGEAYASEVDNFISANKNWISIRQENKLRLNADYQKLRFAEFKKREEEKRIAREVREAEERRLQQIASGTYMPDEIEVGRACKELAEENTLTKRVDWGWFGAANSRWFPQQKTIILEGKTKNAFGVEIPFNIECKWEKGGVVRIVEMSR